jgi:hypothetical protein
MFLALIPLIISIISELPGLIQKAELAFGGKPGSGPAKKEFVVGAAGAALDAFNSLSSHPLAPDHVSAVLNTVSSITDATVSAFNTAGVFQNAPPPPTVADALKKA